MFDTAFCHNCASTILHSIQTFVIRVKNKNNRTSLYGLLARYAKLLVAHAPGMPGTFSPPPQFSYPDMHHGTCVTHVPWCMPGSLTSGFLWSRWRGKCSRHFRRMRNPQFYLSGKRPLLESGHPSQQWHHKERDVVSNHQPNDCLLKENIKTPRHRPLWWESTGHQWIPLTKGEWRQKCFHLMTSSCCHLQHQLKIFGGDFQFSRNL